MDQHGRRNAGHLTRRRGINFCGRSGNPGGRPKALADVQAYARQQTNRAIDVLAAIMIDEKASPAARIAAANALLDRGYGKPTFIVDTFDDTRDVREWTTAELDAFFLTRRFGQR